MSEALQVATFFWVAKSFFFVRVKKKNWISAA